MKPICRVCQHFHMEPTEPRNRCKLVGVYRHYNDVCIEFLAQPHLMVIDGEIADGSCARPHLQNQEAD